MVYRVFNGIEIDTVNIRIKLDGINQFAPVFSPIVYDVTNIEEEDTAITAARPTILATVFNFIFDLK